MSGVPQNRGAPLTDLAVVVLQRTGRLVEAGDGLAQGLSILLTPVILRDPGGSLGDRADLGEVVGGDHHPAGTWVPRGAPVRTRLAGGGGAVGLAVWGRGPHTVPIHGFGA